MGVKEIGVKKSLTESDAIKVDVGDKVGEFVRPPSPSTLGSEYN